MADLGVLSYLGKDAVTVMKRAERKQQAVSRNKVESEVARRGRGWGTRG